MLFHSAHSPSFREKLHFGERASLKTGLEQDAKTLDFHFTPPAKKGRNATFPI